MKNYIRLPFFAIIVSLSAVACKGNKSTDSGDSVKSPKTDSAMSVKSKSDTTFKTDTVKASTDSTEAKIDTVGKTVTKHTVVKKTVSKTTKK